MSHSPSILIHEDGGETVNIPNEGTVIGRGQPGCNFITATAVSRSHVNAKLLHGTQGLELEALGNNPLVAFFSDGTSVQVLKGKKIEIRNGESFELVPGQFRLQFIYGEEPAAQPKPAQAGKLAKLPSTTELPASASKKVKPTVSNMNVVTSRNITSKKVEAPAPIPSKKSEAKPNKVVDANPAPAKRPAETLPPSKKQKLTAPDCKYGEECYNLNPSHRTAYSHSSEPDKALFNLPANITHLYFEEGGDQHEGPSEQVANESEEANEEDEEREEEQDPVDERPVCPHGEKCYRKNPKHFVEFQHAPKNNQPKPTPSKQTSQKPAMQVYNEEDDDEEGEGDEPKPLHVMQEGETVDFQLCLLETTKQANRYENMQAFNPRWRLGRDAVVGSAKPSGKPSEKKIPGLLLAHKWELDKNPLGWWISEKLDGVRAYWDGKRFWSRLGNEFFPPDFFKEGLPSWPLDGELWVGRQKFQKTMSIVRSKDGNKYWADVSYKVFDAPALAEPFERRMEALKAHFSQHPAPYVSLVEQFKCETIDQLKHKLKEVEDLGGEGLMLRQPGSSYVGSRSTTLLKLKSFFDSEARIVKHEPGKGKYSGLCGSLLCELGDGTKFAVGSGMSDSDRKHPPPVGSIITFRYQEVSDMGVPRFPTYVGVRDDAKWPPDPDTQPKKYQGPKAGGFAKSAKAEKEPNPKPAPIAKPAVKPVKNPSPGGQKPFTKLNGNPKAALEGLTLVMTGTHSLVRREFGNLIEAHGGVLASAVTGRTTHLIATKDEMQIKTSKVQSALAKGVPIVSESFIHDCIAAGHPVNHTKFILEVED